MTVTGTGATPSAGSRHVSLRLRHDVYERLDATAEAVRGATGESRSGLAARLIDEGLRMQAHPGVVFRPGPAGRRPALVGGPDVWEVARVLRDVAADAARHADPAVAGSAAAQAVDDEGVLVVTAERTGLPLHQVRAAARYRAAFPDEVDAWIAAVDAEADATGPVPRPAG